ncbi:MAG: AAA family ATPase [Candidatus Zixiibacteriota bacterium]|nr:MAG: AAA family ATPase [candidate division Zixibacteria bacterium]
MFLKHIKLENVRCFDNLEISFTRGDGSIRKWTLLLSENGTGKTNLLQAIGLITAGSDALSDLLGDPRDWIRYGQEFCEIHATLITKDGEERDLKLRINRGDDRSEVIVRNKASLAPIDDAIEHADRNYFVAGYGASRRLNLSQRLRGKESKTYQRRAQNVASLFDAEAVLTPLESWAMDLDYQDERIGAQVVRKVLNSFLPGVSFSRIDKKKGRLLFRTPDGIVPLYLLSDGYRNMAGWIGDLLYRITETFRDYKSPLKARGLLLIDEVALHLHVKWQRVLLDFLDKKLPNFQLVATTHSPIAAQQADAGELHYLERERKKIKLQEFSGNPRNLLLNQLITADLFGLETDESQEIEAKKEKYKKLRDKRRLSVKEKAKLEKMKEELKELPVRDRDNVALQRTHLNLLKRIQQELSEKQ